MTRLVRCGSDPYSQDVNGIRKVRIVNIPVLARIRLRGQLYGHSGSSSPSQPITMPASP